MELLFIRDQEGDWEGLYKDGQLITQGHSIDWPYVLESILKGSDISLETANANLTWLYECGQFPDDLQDVVFQQ